MQVQLERIAAVNPRVNAIVTLLDPELALRAAAEADSGEFRGVLHGLPIAVKDLEDTAGMRTTYGSPLFAEHVPEHDSLLVARLRRAGAIVIGKTNTPELGAGSQTFNNLEWFRSCSRITVTAQPAIAVPAGFRSGGLPIGLQLVGRHRGELALLRLAAAFTEATGLAERTPALD